MKIKLFVMDVDGTLTDGRIILGSDGTEYKHFNVKDGMGIKLLKEKGIVPVIITGRSSTIVDYRCKELGISELHQGISNKLNVLKGILEKNNVQFQEVAYIGDDINDLEAMTECGARFAVGNAAQEVKNIATYVTESNGGDGAVREAIEYILKNN